MRIGLMIGADDTTRGIDDLVALGQRAEALGFASVWMANIFSFDAITALTLIGRATRKIELGTAWCRPIPGIRRRWRSRL